MTKKQSNKSAKLFGEIVDKINKFVNEKVRNDQCGIGIEMASLEVET
jgi:hypothetical protein